MTRFLITRGLQASGKSTFAKDWVSQDPDNRRRVNRDDLRMALFGRYTGVDENFVTKVQRAAIVAALKDGRDVISDDTNLNAKFVKELLKIASAEGAEVEWHDEFLDVPLETLYQRDAQREKSVGRDVITDFYRRYLASGKRPKRPEIVVDELKAVREYIPIPGTPEAFLVDLDGTIADMGDRRGPFDWHRVGDDYPVAEVIDLVHILESHGMIPLFISGREDVCFMETFQWIRYHVYDGEEVSFVLRMRKAKDGRKDSIVKAEIFDNYIRDHYDVKFVIDDRRQVIDMYRALGLTVLDVAGHDF